MEYLLIRYKDLEVSINNGKNNEFTQDNRQYKEQ